MHPLNDIILRCYSIMTIPIIFFLMYYTSFFFLVQELIHYSKIIYFNVNDEMLQ
jgi:hypothetical protein